MYLICIGLTRTYRILFEEVNSKICKEVIVGNYWFLLMCVLFQFGVLDSSLHVAQLCGLFSEGCYY